MKLVYTLLFIFSCFFTFSQSDVLTKTVYLDNWNKNILYSSKKQAVSDAEKKLLSAYLELLKTDSDQVQDLQTKYKILTSYQLDSLKEDVEFQWILEVQKAKLILTHHPKLGINTLHKIAVEMHKIGYHDLSAYCYALIGREQVKDGKFYKAIYSFKKSMEMSDWLETHPANTSFVNHGLYAALQINDSPQISFFEKQVQSKVIPSNDACNLLLLEINKLHLAQNQGQIQALKKTLYNKWSKQKFNAECKELIPLWLESLLLKKKIQPITPEIPLNQLFSEVMFLTRQQPPILAQRILRVLFDVSKQNDFQNSSLKNLTDYEDIYYQYEENQEKIASIIMDLKLDEHAKRDQLFNESIMINRKYKESMAMLISTLLGLFVLAFIYHLFGKKEEIIRKTNEKMISVDDKKNKLLETIKDMQDEILDLNLKLGIKAETERTLKESLSEAHNLSPSGLREMLKNLQIQLNNLTQIDRKTMDGSLLSNQGRNEREKFVKMLKAKHPNISDAEAHLAHYIRLKLNNKEIGLATGISNGSVRVYKSKLKSKIGIPNHDSLTEYLEKL